MSKKSEILVLSLFFIYFLPFLALLSKKTKYVKISADLDMIKKIGNMGTVPIF